MFYITGDTHGDFERIEYFCNDNKTNIDDVLIILGDAGINYYNNKKDIERKEYIKKFPITLFCIHGNHECRPQTIKTYKEKKWNRGIVFFEEAYPNILFAKDGEVYDIEGNKCIVIGGAYSVDKGYRLEMGYRWFADEQPDDVIKKHVEQQIQGNKIDIVLSHTCPIKYEPVEFFMSCVDQSSVDKSTEIWLGKIEESLDYKKWYCGHYHCYKIIDKMRFLFDTIEEFRI